MFHLLLLWTVGAYWGVGDLLFLFHLQSELLHSCCPTGLVLLVEFLGPPGQHCQQEKATSPSSLYMVIILSLNFHGVCFGKRIQSSHKNIIKLLSTIWKHTKSILKKPNTTCQWNVIWTNISDRSLLYTVKWNDKLFNENKKLQPTILLFFNVVFKFFHFFSTVFNGCYILYKKQHFCML